MLSVIPKNKQEKILDLLVSIEKRKQIKVLHAVESGSRAWGFPSSDSDYDVRFIYVHPSEWYLSAFQKKDHVDPAFVFDIDASGWDVTKCIRLLYRGNAVVHEWLNSPVVYRSDKNAIEQLSDLAGKVFNPAAAFYHYYSLAKKRFAEERTKQHAKSYLYGLRAILCAKWIVEENSVPPVLFSHLVDRFFPYDLSSELAILLELKRSGAEQAIYEVPDDLWSQGVKWVEHLSGVSVKANRVGDSETYDRVLRDVLREN